MAERSEAVGQDGVHTDQDPLIEGRRSLLDRMAGVSASLRQAWSWRRFRGDRAASAPAGSDLEVGASGLEQRTDSGEPASSSGRAIGIVIATAEATVASQQQGTPSGDEKASVSGDSPRTRQGLLGRLMSAGSTSIPRSASANFALQPTCLICLETLTQEDFQSGEAISLDCQCRGEVALRHRSCAEKWVNVKGNRVCDICKTVVRNLPEPAPRSPEAESRGADEFGDGGDGIAIGGHGFTVEQVPGSADVIFDCIRVTWVAMIVCILFFEMNLATALWTGLIVGLAYTLFVRAMYRNQLAAMQREMLREQQRNNGDSPPGQPHPMVVVV